MARTGAAATHQRVTLWILAALALLIGAAFGLSLLPLMRLAELFGEWVRSLGAAGVLLIGAAYILGTLLLVPGTALTIAAALAYGWYAVPLVFVAATLGAIPPFLIARYLFHHRLSGWLANHRTADAVVHAVNTQSWQVALLLRFSPAVPFNAQNYLLGITAIPLPVYAATTALGILPGVATRVYVAVAGLTLGRGADLIEWTLLGLGLIATVAVTLMIARAARARLREIGLSEPG